MLGSQTGAQVNDPGPQTGINPNELARVRPRDRSSASGSSWRTAGTGHPDRSDRAGRESLIQAAEDGNHLVDGHDGEDPADSRTGDDEPDLAAFSPGAPMGAEQRVQPGGVAEASPRHVDHVGFPSSCGRPEQGGPEPVCVGNVDLFGGDHHRQAADFLDGERDLTHLHHLGGTARRPGALTREPRPPWSGSQFFGLLLPDNRGVMPGAG